MTDDNSDLNGYVGEATESYKSQTGNGTAKSLGACKPAKMEVTCLADIIGESGPWQRRVCFLKIFFTTIVAFNALGKSFYAPKQDYHCVDPTTSLPVYVNGTLQRCGCSKWAYEGDFGPTIISEWDLVCEYSWMASATQSVFMAGVITSLLVMSQVSDLCGRVPTFQASHLIEIAGGVVCYFSGNVWHFAAGRFLIAVGSYGKAMCMHMLVIEALGTTRRAFWTQLNTNGWLAGYLMLPLVAYYIRNFRHMQLAVTGFLVLQSLCFLWLSESPRWLLARGRTNEAEVIIRQAIRDNGRSDERLKERIGQLADQIKKEHLGIVDEEPQSSGKVDVTAKAKSPYVQILTAKKLRVTLLVMTYTWFTHGFVWYGISLNMDQFQMGDSVGVYLSFFLGGLVEIPTFIINIVALNYMGRTHLMSGCLIGTGLSLAASIYFEMTSSGMGWQLVTALLGKFCISAGFNLVYLMAMELFPTVLRQTATGLCSTGARVGGMLAPFVKEISESFGLWVALALFAGLSLTNGLLVFLLPEMRGKDIPDSVAAADNIRKRKSIISLT